MDDYTKHAWQGIGLETLGLGVAEFTSMGVSLGVVGLADTLAPSLMNSASRTLSKICIEPYLDPIEKGLASFCKLDECQPDMTKPKEERAEHLAHTVIVFGAAWAASMAAKLATRKGMRVLMEGKDGKQSKFALPKGKTFLKLDAHDWKIFAADESVHLGSFFLVNNGAAKHTDNAIKSVSNIFEKTLGVSKRTANAMASMGVVWELPNALGFVAGTGVIVHDHLKAANNARKAVQSALSHGYGHSVTP